mgnify:CR=1 FL=1
MVKLKIDHNLSPNLKDRLTALGHDVDTAAGEGLAEADDDTLESAAREAGRMLFTEDKRFVDERRYPPGTHSGAPDITPAQAGVVFLGD